MLELQLRRLRNPFSAEPCRSSDGIAHSPEGARHMPDDDRTSHPTSPQEERWRELAEKASKEPDSKKLLEEVEELCKELEKREAKLRKGPRATP